MTRTLSERLPSISLAIVLSLSLLGEVAHAQSAPIIYPSAGQSMD